MIVVPDVAVDGYARLLPVIETFRADARYTVAETAGFVTISGPSSIDAIEKRFVLPADLAFDRVNKQMVHLFDEGIGITFQPPSSKFWQGWRALEGYPRSDETAGDHTVH